MKRDSNIIPLSREHHYGLLFCWKIRQGLAKKIHLERIRQYVMHFWRCCLECHFVEEESLLFRERIDFYCLTAVEEHSQIRCLVRAIHGSGRWIESNYNALADKVDKHIRFEEREVFPFLEKEMTKEELERVGAQLLKLHTTPADDIYEDAFWS